MKTETELRELDAWIAEHVMGWRRTHNPDDHTTDGATLFWHRPASDKREAVLKGRAYQLQSSKSVEMFSHSWEFYAPTTDPAAAMMVLEKCAGKVNVTIAEVGLVWDVMARDWDRVNTGDQIQPELVSAQGDTLPLAICLFAKRLYSNDQCEAQTKTGE